MSEDRSPLQAGPRKPRIGVQVGVTALAPLEMKPSGASDHRCIVRVQAGLGDHHPYPPGKVTRHHLREGSATCHSTAEHHGRITGSLYGPVYLVSEHVEHGGLKGRREVGLIPRDIGRSSHGMEHCGLQPAERKVEPVTSHRTRQVEAIRPTVCHGLDGGAPGVSETEKAGHFVEGLSRRVVPGLTEDAVAPPIGYVEE